MSEKQQFATFYLADRYFGVEVKRVQEILRTQKMTHVPLSSLVIGGLINLRGQIVTAVDMRQRLGLGNYADGQQPMNVVVHSSSGGVSLLVDDIDDVVEAEDSTFESPPETLDRNVRRIICGVHKLKGKLMHVLDVDEVLNGFTGSEG